MKDTKTVFKLRKEKKLREALELSRLLIKENPDDEWTIRAFGWTLISCIKENIYGKNIEELKKLKDELINLKIDNKDKLLLEHKAKTLELSSPIGEKIIEASHLSKNSNNHFKAKNILLEVLKVEPNNGEALKTICWVIYRQLKSQKNLDFDILLNEAKSYYLKIKDGDSLLLRQLTIISSNVSTKCSSYPEFIRECVIPNITTTPVIEPSLNDQLSFHIKPSLAEIVLKGFYKHLKSFEENIKQVSTWFSKILKSWDSIEFVDKEWSNYYYGRLLAWCTDKNDDALKSLLPIARTKKNEFWIWDALADCMDTDEMRIACYCRSINSNYGNEFSLKNIYVKLASLWYIYDNKAASSYVASKAKELFEIKKQVLPEDLEYIIESDWYEPTLLSKNDFENIVQKYSSKADSLLFSDLKIYPSNFISETFNSEKGLYYSDFALKDGNTAMLKTNYSLNLEPGTNCNIRFQEIDSNRKRVVWWEKCEGTKWNLVEFKPAIVIHTDKKKGFLLAAISKDFNTIMHYDKFSGIQDFKIGDIIQVRSVKNSKGKFFTIDWQNSPSQTELDFVSTFNGCFTFADDFLFGFVHSDNTEIFISPEFTDELNDYDSIGGIAIYQRKRDGEYGWKALRIDKHIPYDEAEDSFEYSISDD